MTIFRHANVWGDPARFDGISAVVEHVVENSAVYYHEDIEALQAKVKTLTAIVGKISEKLQPDDQVELAALFHLEPGE